jgi:uncharacterized membrane protein YeaQ/YmgE (transglycosylase-associated protein family)
MIVPAQIVLDPSTLVAWLVIGAACAWFAGKVLNEASYGLMGDVVVGVIGAFVGGCLLGLLVSGQPVFWSTMLLAALGACVLIGIARAIAAARGA